ncbi:NAD(P)H-dependent oxidoreductase [Patescibacteria group bacterium]|nr:NAD(P)H-dependent oxidoreductase [Patescibacteria group bacterium]MBU1705840.1 NAD(P)H-dependent oxidoreductase [Patescibacteria group bacterium]
MKSLIITAHPSAEGFTHQIARAYKKAKGQTGGTADIINLYSKKWQQPFLSFQDHAHFSDWPKTKTLENFQAKIKAADELVFCFPVWWFGAPAILKNFLDVNLTAHFAYYYDQHGRPHGLLKGKTAKIFVTAGGPAWMYLIKIEPLAKDLTAALQFCGIKTVQKLICGNREEATHQSEQAFLDKVINSAGK